MVDRTDIPRERCERNPLITDSAYARLRAILEHPCAPAWNYDVGDRVIAADHVSVERMRQLLRRREAVAHGVPPGSILEWVERMRPQVPLLQRALPEGFRLERDWRFVPTMCRADIALRLEQIVPLDADLSRLIVYDTSGVTGHAIQVPHHPAAMAQNHPMIEYVLGRHGVRLQLPGGRVACLNVGAQISTVTFATVFSVWDNAGFAKVNLHRRAWTPGKARAFFAELAPQLVTGDPLGFAEMAAWDIDVRPAAMLSTAVALTPALRDSLAARYGCPVIDSYATTETGPIGYANPEGTGFSILPPDIFVEVVDQTGVPVAEGELGEICVTGGRNPFLPLLRYRTGDFGRMRYSAVRESDPAPVLYDLRAREPVSFVAADNSVVSMVDVARVVRTWPLVQHEFVQHADRSCALVIQPLAGSPPDVSAIRAELEELFGCPVSVSLDPALGDKRSGGKAVPFRSTATPPNVSP